MKVNKYKYKVNLALLGNPFGFGNLKDLMLKTAYFFSLF
jgi:hypothetical protein